MTQRVVLKAYYECVRCHLGGSAGGGGWLREDQTNGVPRFQAPCTVCHATRTFKRTHEPGKMPLAVCELEDVPAPD